jgi:hypothetical protein
VVQGQLDQVHDQLAIVEDERPVRVDQPGFPVALDDGLPFDERTALRWLILAWARVSAHRKVGGARQPGRSARLGMFAADDGAS